MTEKPEAEVKRIETLFQKMVRKMSMLGGINNGNNENHDKSKKIP